MSSIICTQMKNTTMLLNAQIIATNSTATANSTSNYFGLISYNPTQSTLTLYYT